MERYRVRQWAKTSNRRRCISKQRVSKARHGWKPGSHSGYKRPCSSLWAPRGGRPAINHTSASSIIPSTSLQPPTCLPQSSSSLSVPPETKAAPLSTPSSGSPTGASAASPAIHPAPAPPPSRLVASRSFRLTSTSRARSLQLSKMPTPSSPSLTSGPSTATQTPPRTNSSPMPASS